MSDRLTMGERHATMSFVAMSGARADELRLEAGQTVAARYRVARFIAGGGTGEVYAADDLLLKDRIALKVLRFAAARDHTALERFRREVALARKVTHPNVCRLFDVGDDGGIAYLTMELLEGKSLSARLDEVERLSCADALPIARQLAAGLDAAHQAGIVHRDFKSQNVILVEGRAVVTDFGLARAAQDGDASLTGAGVLVGTPAYMAPEQVEGRPTTARTDVYAFGVVLFEMVTGRLPFIGETPLATAIKRIKELPPSPRDLVPGIDARWEAAILRCLSERPEDRFASASEVVAALEASAPVTVAAPRPLPKRTLRGKLVVVGAGTAAVAVVIGAIGVLSDGGPRAQIELASQWPAPAPLAPGAAGDVGDGMLDREPAAPRAPLITGGPDEGERRFRFKGARAPVGEPVEPAEPVVPPEPPEPFEPPELAGAADEVRRAFEEARLARSEAAIQATGELEWVVIPDLLGVPPAEIQKSARVVKATDSERPGVRVQRVTPGGWAERLGIQEGDVLHAVNGLALGDRAAALRAWNRLADAREVALEITRDDEPVTLSYHIVRPIP